MAHASGHVGLCSISTNDLPQKTYGLSRDDAAEFLPVYLDQRIIPNDPTETIDQAGVGRLMELCVAEARADPRAEAGDLRRARP